MKPNYRKSLRLITLLITSLLIATVSAQVYRYMYIDGSITVSSAKMIWILGDDAPAGSSIDGSTATINFNVEQGTPINFTEALLLKNDNATGSFSILISVTTAVAGADFNTAKMHIYENSTTVWVFVDTIDLTNGADTYSGTLDAGEYLRLKFEIEAATGASGNKPFDIQVRYN